MKNASWQNIVQVVGIHDLAEALLLVQAGVDIIGFALHLNYHTPDITEEHAASVIQQLPQQIKVILVTYLNDALTIGKLTQYLGIKLVQLHGEISINELIRLRKYDPELSIIKSLVIKELPLQYYLKQITAYSPYVDAFITDTYDVQTGASGATGKTHDWTISKQIVQYSPHPVILAGGLNVENITEAILQVQPAGVDVHTGVEEQNGRKNYELVHQFVMKAKQAFCMLTPNATHSGS